MLSMPHSSKLELNKIFCFYIFGGFHVEFMCYVIVHNRVGMLSHRFFVPEPSLIRI